jgi:NAD(P)-dependent dehydrogenase (short-subunit alcohol dehydrogenase family)
MADPTGMTGKVALITGAARYRGIGRAIALRLAEDGADIVVCGRPRAPTSFPAHEQEMGWQGVGSLAEEIRQKGRRALAVDCDVTKKEQVVAMVDAVKSEFGRLDIIVNNAGVPSNAGSSPILDTDEDVWYETMDVNVNGVFLVTKYGGRLMRDCGNGGAIVMIASLAGRKYHLPDGSFRQQLENFIPMGRQGRVSELAAVVSFMCSSDASYVTGQTINVDGGARLD